VNTESSPHVRVVKECGESGETRKGQNYRRDLLHRNGGKEGLWAKLRQSLDVSVKVGKNLRGSLGRATGGSLPLCCV